VRLKTVQPAAEYLISVDAGLDGLGIAAWDLRVKTLLKTAYLPTPHRNLNQTREDVFQWLNRSDMGILPIRGYKHVRCVIEQMKVLKQGQSKGDPKYLIQIANVIGAVGSLFPVLDLPEPFDWKRNLPKSVTRRALIRDLEPEERRILAAGYPPRSSLSHNVDDAAALGLRALISLRLRKANLERWSP
jgi:hypothetical protein